MTHSELELNYLLKLFNLELKDNDPMTIAIEIKAIMHDINATSVKAELALTSFFKALYLTYSHSIASAREKNGAQNNTQVFYKSHSRGNTPTPTNGFEALIKNISLEYIYACWEDGVDGIVG